ncbi:MAG: hypothetical protein ABR579_10560 [Actinomycetota bacterium]
MIDHESSEMTPEEQDQGERPRPRVVDKRARAGGAASAAAEPTTQATSPDPSSVPETTAAESAEPAEAPAPAAESGTVWTPEQEEQARRIAEEIVQTPSTDWVINTAVTLANVAATKLELGDPNDASLAIDALAALINGLDTKLGEALAPLRSTLAQLQMGFARIVAAPQKPDAERPPV